MAEELLKIIASYRIGTVYKLMDVLGISLREKPMAIEIGGLYYMDEAENENVIILNSKIKNSIQQRFICAYLVAHHVLKNGPRVYFSDIHLNEIETLILAHKIIEAAVLSTDASREMSIQAN